MRIENALVTNIDDVEIKSKGLTIQVITLNNGLILEAWKEKNFVHLADTYIMLVSDKVTAKGHRYLNWKQPMTPKAGGPTTESPETASEDEPSPSQPASPASPDNPSSSSVQQIQQGFQHIREAFKLLKEAGIL